jgi:hypothetical protein
MISNSDTLQSNVTADFAETWLQSNIPICETGVVREGMMFPDS